MCDWLILYLWSHISWYVYVYVRKYHYTVSSGLGCCSLFADSDIVILMLCSGRHHTMVSGYFFASFKWSERRCGHLDRHLPLQNAGRVSSRHVRYWCRYSRVDTVPSITSAILDRTSHLSSLFTRRSSVCLLFLLPSTKLLLWYWAAMVLSYLWKLAM